MLSSRTLEFSNPREGSFLIMRWQVDLTMKIKPRLVTTALAAFAVLTTMAEAQSTVENLNHAYQAESNSANRYRQFAQKADAESFKQVAKLFRAAAASEDIHRQIIEKSLQKTGGRIETFKLDEVALASTAENLRRSIESESAESGSIYAGFLSSAKASKEKSAIRAFNYTLECDKKLARHFQQALVSLDSKASITYYLCGDCGLILTELPKKKCPVCREGLKEFKIIN